MEWGSTLETHIYSKALKTWVLHNMLPLNKQWLLHLHMNVLVTVNVNYSQCHVEICTSVYWTVVNKKKKSFKKVNHSSLLELTGHSYHNIQEDFNSLNCQTCSQAVHLCCYGNVQFDKGRNIFIFAKQIHIVLCCLSLYLTGQIYGTYNT